MRQALRDSYLQAVKASVFLLVLLMYVPRGATQGLATEDLVKLRSVGAVALSPEGHHLAYTVTMFDEPGRPYAQLWIMDLATEKSIRVGGEKDRGSGPVWSPDGKVLAFVGKQGERHGLMIAKAEGSDVTELVSPEGSNSPLPGMGNQISWSPDGKQIAYISSTPDD